MARPCHPRRTRPHGPACKARGASSDRASSGRRKGTCPSFPEQRVSAYDSFCGAVLWYACSSCHSRQQETRSYEGACFFFLSAELGAVKLGKIASLPHELIECSLLDDFSSAHDDDQIGLADCGETVSNDERGATGSWLLEGFSDMSLGFGV